MAFFNSTNANLAGWSWPEMKPIWSASQTPYFSCWDLKCSSKGCFAFAEYKGGVVIGDGATGKILQEWQSNDAIRHLAFTPDGEHLITVDYENRGGTIRIWNSSSGQLIREFKTDARYCEAIDVSPDGKTLGVKADHCCLFWQLDALLK